MINGKHSSWIEAKSGFHQGYPLSPYLFILFSQLLSNVFNEKEHYLGNSIVSNGPRISHLLYADDILIFFEAKIKVVKEIKGILIDFCGWTGQRMNMKKSSILFGKYVKKKKKNFIQRIMRFKVVKELYYFGSKWY